MFGWGAYKQHDRTLYTEERAVDSHPSWSSAFLEMQRSIMHTALLCTEEPHELPYTNFYLSYRCCLSLVSFLTYGLNCAGYYNGIGRYRQHKGNILNIVTSRTHFKMIVVSFSHHKLCFFGGT